MLDKLFGKKSPTQSQSIGNITTNGGQVQVGQAGNDLAQAMSGENASQRQGLSGADVVALLEQLMGAIESSTLTAEQKREAAKEEPDKALMGANLKNVGETMKNLKETTEAGKTIWATGVDVFKAIGPWVGLAAGLLG
jgi:phage-related protein